MISPKFRLPRRVDNPLAPTNEFPAHPTAPGWQVAVISIARLAHPLGPFPPTSFFGLNLTDQHAAALLAAVENALRLLPARTLAALHFGEIASLDQQLWVELGPELSRRVLAGDFGRTKRLIYLFGESQWLTHNLEWAFETAWASQPVRPGRAVLAPGMAQGYCGTLAPIYAESLSLVNQAGSMSSLELYSQLQRRYRLAPAHADQCLAGLAQLGLLYRQSHLSNRYSTYDLNARGYALSLAEEYFQPSVISHQSSVKFRAFSRREERFS